ncbi:MAG: ATP synthase F0 subunit B [Desulfobacteraceae bacterium]|nr:ATP synthase F0 subunit B [Desulfobacteraceae bacterium]
MKSPGLFRIFNPKSLVVVVLCIGLVTVLSGGLAGAASGGDDHGGGHGAESKGWVTEDTYRVMNFVVLALVLFFLLRKPASQALGDRIKGIREQLEDLEAKKADAEKNLADYNDKLANLEKETESIIAEYIKQGEQAKERILKEAEASAEKLEEQAKKNIEHEFKQAKIILQADIMEKAMAKAELLIKEKISADDQERLVDEYLEKVVS